MDTEEKRRARLALLQTIAQVQAVGEPFNDALFLCATALAAEDAEARKRALAKISGRLRMQSALLQMFQSNVVNTAREMGEGTLPFAEAAASIGETFGDLRDSYVSQLRRIML